MNRYISFLLFFLLCCPTLVLAQLDSVQKLPEIVLSDLKLVHFSDGFKIDRLGDSIVKRNYISLTDILQLNSSIYFKENGYGMVSSPSLRGTNASQTAVIWNGININSIFTGQTDFNIISPYNYDEISVRYNGGGVQYGSGAVGGSIHLNNNFYFDDPNETEIGVRLGGFGTIGGNANTVQKWKDHYLNVGVDFVSSQNDYDYIGKGKKNSHGEFLGFTAKVNEARRLSRGYATWNSEYSYHDRNFSGSLNTLGRDGYKDVNTRNLWQLKQRLGNFHATARIAHLFEQYRYYPDKAKDNNSQGRANTFIGGVDSEFFLNTKIRFNAKVVYSLIAAQGDNVGEHSRKTLATVILLKHKPIANFSYAINLRKEFANDYKNPLLFSVDAKWNVTNTYYLRLNGSKNYRVPTFNDLYWYAGGNRELDPERSYQLELGQEILLGKFNLDVSAYYISTQNLIKWVPGGGSLWKPSNISETENMGVEVKGIYGTSFLEDHNLKAQVLYSYVRAEDKEKHKQLIYVPFHKVNLGLSYQYKGFSTYLQGLYNGRAFTTTDNSEFVKAYSIYNLGAEYNFHHHPNITLGGRINNALNTYYENVAFRPMPSRYFEIFINFNI